MLQLGWFVENGSPTCGQYWLVVLHHICLAYILLIWLFPKMLRSPPQLRAVRGSIRSWWLLGYPSSKHPCCGSGLPDDWSVVGRNYEQSSHPSVSDLVDVNHGIGLEENIRQMDYVYLSVLSEVLAKAVAWCYTLLMQVRQPSTISYFAQLCWYNIS